MNKKRSLIFTICLSVLSMAINAQGPGPVAPPPKNFALKFGLKAGVNLANISNGETNINFTPGMKADFHLGAVANLHLGYKNEGSPVGTGMFGLQPELLYSRQGFVVDKEAYSLNYLTLPVMIKCYVADGINIEAGPYISYLFGVSPNTTVIDNAQIKLSDIKGGLDAGVSIGVGYEMKMGLTAGARYMLGLSDMANNLAWKNNVITVSVGWLF